MVSESHKSNNIESPEAILKRGQEVYEKALSQADAEDVKSGIKTKWEVAYQMYKFAGSSTAAIEEFIDQYSDREASANTENQPKNEASEFYRGLIDAAENGKTDEINQSLEERFVELRNSTSSETVDIPSNIREQGKELYSAIPGEQENIDTPETKSFLRYMADAMGKTQYEGEINEADISKWLTDSFGMNDSDMKNRIAGSLKYLRQAYGAFDNWKRDVEKGRIEGVSISESQNKASEMVGAGATVEWDKPEDLKPQSPEVKKTEIEPATEGGVATAKQTSTVEAGSVTLPKPKGENQIDSDLEKNTTKSEAIKEYMVEEVEAAVAQIEAKRKSIQQEEKTPENIAQHVEHIKNYTKSIRGFELLSKRLQERVIASVTSEGHYMTAGLEHSRLDENNMFDFAYLEGLNKEFNVAKQAWEKAQATDEPNKESIRLNYEMIKDKSSAALDYNVLQEIRVNQEKLHDQLGEVASREEYTTIHDRIKNNNKLIQDLEEGLKQTALRTQLRGFGAETREDIKVVDFAQFERDASGTPIGVVLLLEQLHEQRIEALVPDLDSRIKDLDTTIRESEMSKKPLPFDAQSRLEDLKMQRKLIKETSPHSLLDTDPQARALAKQWAEHSILLLENNMRDAETSEDNVRYERNEEARKVLVTFKDSFESNKKTVLQTNNAAEGPVVESQDVSSASTETTEQGSEATAIPNSANANETPEDPAYEALNDPLVEPESESNFDTEEYSDQMDELNEPVPERQHLSRKFEDDEVMDENLNDFKKRLNILKRRRDKSQWLKEIKETNPEEYEKYANTPNTSHRAQAWQERGAGFPTKILQYLSGNSKVEGDEVFDKIGEQFKKTGKEWFNKESRATKKASNERAREDEERARVLDKRIEAIERKLSNYEMRDKSVVARTLERGTRGARKAVNWMKKPENRKQWRQRVLLSVGFAAATSSISLLSPGAVVATALRATGAYAGTNIAERLFSRHYNSGEDFRLKRIQQYTRIKKAIESDDSRDLAEEMQKWKDHMEDAGEQGVMAQKGRAGENEFTQMEVQHSKDLRTRHRWRNFVKYATGMAVGFGMNQSDIIQKIGTTDWLANNEIPFGELPPQHTEFVEVDMARQPIDPMETLKVTEIPNERVIPDSLGLDGTLVLQEESVPDTISRERISEDAMSRERIQENDPVDKTPEETPKPVATETLPKLDTKFDGPKLRIHQMGTFFANDYQIPHPDGGTILADRQLIDLVRTETADMESFRYLNDYEKIEKLGYKAALVEGELAGTKQFAFEKIAEGVNHGKFFSQSDLFEYLVISEEMPSTDALNEISAQDAAALEAAREAAGADSTETGNDNSDQDIIDRIEAGEVPRYEAPTTEGGTTGDSTIIDRIENDEVPRYEAPSEIDSSPNPEADAGIIDRIENNQVPLYEAPTEPNFDGNTEGTPEAGSIETSSYSVPEVAAAGDYNGRLARYAAFNEIFSGFGGEFNNGEVVFETPGSASENPIRVIQLEINGEPQHFLELEVRPDDKIKSLEYLIDKTVPVENGLFVNTDDPTVVNILNQEMFDHPAMTHDQSERILQTTTTLFQEPNADGTGYGVVHRYEGITPEYLETLKDQYENISPVEAEIEAPATVASPREAFASFEGDRFTEISNEQYYNLPDTLENAEVVYDGSSLGSPGENQHMRILQADVNGTDTYVLEFERSSMDETIAEDKVLFEARNHPAVKSLNIDPITALNGAAEGSKVAYIPVTSEYAATILEEYGVDASSVTETTENTAATVVESEPLVDAETLSLSEQRTDLSEYLQDILQMDDSSLRSLENINIEDIENGDQEVLFRTSNEMITGVEKGAFMTILKSTVDDQEIYTLQVTGGSLDDMGTAQQRLSEALRRSPLIPDGLREGMTATVSEGGIDNSSVYYQMNETYARNLAEVLKNIK